MRARLLAVGALLALVGAPSAQARGCARTLPHGPHVPAPVVFRTVCGVFELRRDGSVAYARSAPWAPAWAPGAVSHPDPRTWVSHPDRLLAVYRDGRLLWRSHVTGGTDNVAVGHGHVAFTSYRRRMGLRWAGMTTWLAPIGGRERMIARNENVIGWTAAGLVTNRGPDVRLRARDGRFLRSLGKARTALQDGDDLVMLRTDGVIVRTNGWRSRKIADLRRAGMTRYPWLQRLDGGMWQVEAGNRVLFLRHDGSRFASLALKRGGQRDPAGSIAGNVLPLPDRSAVLFVVSRRKTWRDPGVYTIYRLDRGHHVPQPLFTARVRRLTCGDWAGLAYRDGHVLFGSNEAGIAIVDLAGRARPIDLSRFTRRLLSQRRNAEDSVFAAWA
jgi:hypothetical protein